MKKYFALLMMLGLCVSGFAQTPKARRADGTECAALPCVVASVSLMDQNQPIPATPAFTPITDGVFRVSAYITTSSGSNKRAEWVTFAGWTDAHGAKQLGLVSATQNSSMGQGLVVQGVGGQPLLYQSKPAGGGGGVGGMTYDLFITVEQLQ